MKRIHELIFFISLIVVLAVISFTFPKGGVDMPTLISNDTITLRFPTISEVLSSGGDSLISIENLLEDRENSMKIGGLPDSVLEARKKLLAAADSMRIKDSLAVADTIAFYEKFFTTNPTRFDCPNGDVSYIVEAVATLRKAAKNGVVSVFHYGDSQIEGDRITGYIRNALQKDMGGASLGLVPAVGAVPSVSLVQTAQDSVERYLVDGTLIQKANHNRYGAMAQVTHLFGDGTLNFQVTSAGKRNASVIKLYYSTKKGFTATLTPDGYEGIEKKSNDENRMYQVMEWKLAKPTQKFKIKLKGDAEIYGVSMFSESGINVTNVGLRGSSGTFFTKINDESFKYIHKDLNTKLVLMEFGGNATPYLNTEKRLTAYYEQIEAQIKYVKKNVPNAKIIFIGPADMAESVDGKLQTYRNLEATIETLRKCALENGCAFWNMYEVMGGKNSIQSWVKSNPPLAATDYIHFSKKGADRIAKLFVESLELYDQYGNFMKGLDKKKKQQAKARKKKLKQMSDELPVDSAFKGTILK